MPYKVLTHDYRPPLQGGKPLFDGAPGCVLPTVPVDMDNAVECGRSGWHYSTDVPTALQIAGLWPGGHPSTVWEFEPLGKRKEASGIKSRAESGRFVRQLSEDEVSLYVRALTEQWAGDHTDRLVASQMEWRRALGRPGRDAPAVEHGLRLTLDARGLTALLRRCYAVPVDWTEPWTWTTSAIIATHDAWEYAPHIAKCCRHTWRFSGTTRRNSRDARDARNALALETAAVMGWINDNPDLLTTGIRDAYTAGLRFHQWAPDTLEWMMS